jgi:hypothetical protein
MVGNLNGITQSGSTALVLPATGTYKAYYIVNPVASTGTFASFQLLKGAGGTNYANISGSNGYNLSTGSQISGQAIFTANANDYVALANNALYPLTLTALYPIFIGNMATGAAGSSPVTSGPLTVHAGTSIFVVVSVKTATLPTFTVSDSNGNTYSAASVISFRAALSTGVQIFYTTNVPITSSLTVTATSTGSPTALLVEVLEVFGSFTSIVQGAGVQNAGPAVSFSVTATSNYGLVLGGLSSPAVLTLTSGTIVETSSYVPVTYFGYALSEAITTGTVTFAGSIAGSDWAGVAIALQSSPSYLNGVENASLQIFQLK